MLSNTLVGLQPASFSILDWFFEPGGRPVLALILAGTSAGVGALGLFFAPGGRPRVRVGLAGLCETSI